MTYYGIDITGKRYMTKKLDNFYKDYPKICIISDGVSMIHAKYCSWTAPAFIHAIKPDDRCGRTVKMAIDDIKSKDMIEI